MVPSANARLMRTIGLRTNPDRQALYAPGSRELAMLADEPGYARPGLHITVNSITIPDDRRPVVDYSFTDDLDQPLVRNRTEQIHG